MRVKYTVSDYRFAPEGDLPPVVISDDDIKEILSHMPELPDAKKERFKKEYNLNEYDSNILTSSKELSEFFEKIAKEFDDYNMLSNWTLTEILRRIDIENNEKFELPFEYKEFIELLKAIKSNKINNNAGKKVLREMFETGKKCNEIIEDLGLVQISDSSEIEKIVDKVLSSNPQSIEDFKNGKNRALGFLVGQVMKESHGKANPQIVNKLLNEKLNK